VVLGVDKLLELVKEKNLVEGLCDRELKNPEGAGFDLRLGELFELEGEGFLGIENRDTPNLKKVAEYTGDDPEELFDIEPGNIIWLPPLNR